MYHWSFFSEYLCCQQTTVKYIYEYLNIFEATKFNLYLKTAVASETVHNHCLWEREFVSIIID